MRSILFTAFLFSTVFLSCSKELDESPTKSEDHDPYKDEFIKCDCSSVKAEESGEYIKAEINGVPVCADMKGGYINSFDNMLTYGKLVRGKDTTYWDNLYMLRNTKDGKFEFAIFMENTHALTKQYPYVLPRANPEVCEIGEFQITNWGHVTSNMCFFCADNDWHWLGEFFQDRISFRADKFENDYFEGQFNGVIRTGSGRRAIVKNGFFRIKLTVMQRDIIIP